MIVEVGIHVSGKSLPRVSDYIQDWDNTIAVLSPKAWRWIKENGEELQDKHEKIPVYLFTQEVGNYDDLQAEMRSWTGGILMDNSDYPDWIMTIAIGFKEIPMTGDDIQTIW